MAVEVKCGASAILDRIRLIETGKSGHPDAASLMHAYIACLTVCDLCHAIIETISESASLRLALRRRLLRLLRENKLQQDEKNSVHELVERSRAIGSTAPTKRVFVDALLSAIFEHLGHPQQQSIIEAWIDRGTKGAAARWLKAASQVPAMFDETAVFAYFRASNDDRAAKALATQASPEFLTTILPEMLDRCEEGWIVSRAAMRAKDIDGAVWATIRSKHPATYLYLRAKLRLSVSTNEAIELVMNCPPNSFMDGSRGLAIWSIGQLGMVACLDEIVARGNELHEKELAAIRKIVG